MLDPVNEHRNWCPWINVEACRVAAELDMEINLLNEAYSSQDAAVVADSSCNGESITSPHSKKLVAVWEESCNILSTHFNIFDPNEPKKTSPFDRLRHVRSLLNLWSSPEPPPSKSLFEVKALGNDKDASSSSNKSSTSLTTEDLLAKAMSTISRKVTRSPLSAATTPPTPSTPQMTRTAKILTPILMQKSTPSPPASASTANKTPSKTVSPSGKAGSPRAAAASTTTPTQGRAATRSTSHQQTSPMATRSNSTQGSNSPGSTPTLPEHKGVVTRTNAQRACQQKWRSTK